MNVEQKLILDRFKPRWYQEPIWEAIESAGYRKLLVVMPRRSGKDITCWNLAIRQCLKKPCLVFYCLPTYAQAKKAIFDAIAMDGMKFLDFIPKELIKSCNASEMKITFINNSILQCIGADSFQTSLVGTNPSAIIFSEWARCNEKAYSYARPILAANPDSWVIMNTTPFGKNHCYHLFNLAQELPDWCVIYQRTSDINHIPEEALQQEREQMDPGLFAQEYECDWNRGVEGSIYGKHLDRLRQAGQITSVSWEPNLLVHTAWDIGVSDASTILWFQSTANNNAIRIIDCYSATGIGLDAYAKVIQDKPYRYGNHYAPHDIAVREWGGGAITRYEKAAQLDIVFTTLPQMLIEDGIENVWTNFHKLWIDETKCKRFIDALENYRKEWDEEKQQFKSKPVHNWASHFADCLRYLCASLPYTQKGLTSDEFARQRAEALYGSNNGLPKLLDPTFNYQGYR